MFIFPAEISTGDTCTWRQTQEIKSAKPTKFDLCWGQGRKGVLYSPRGQKRDENAHYQWGSKDRPTTHASEKGKGNPLLLGGKQAGTLMGFWGKEELKHTPCETVILTTRCGASQRVRKKQPTKDNDGSSIEKTIKRGHRQLGRTIEKELCNSSRAPGQVRDPIKGRDAQSNTRR